MAQTVMPATFDARPGQRRFHWRSVLLGLLAAELLFVVLIAAGWVVAHAQEASNATPPLATDFVWALDEGSERVLFLEGGFAGQPTAVRIRDASGVTLASGETRALDPTINAGVCTGTRARWPIWWSRTISEPVADALRRQDYQTYVFEALVEGAWQRIRLTDTGCRHRGAG